MDKLKSCPFCGGKAKYQYFAWAQKDEDKKGSNIACENESCEILPSVWGTSRAKATKVWNTRKGEIK